MCLPEGILCGHGCAAAVVMGFETCLIGSDRVFQMLWGGRVCTDASSCQGCHPDVTVLGKPVMDDLKLGKSGVALALCGVLLASVCACVRACLYAHMGEGVSVRPVSE